MKITRRQRNLIRLSAIIAAPVLSIILLWLFNTAHLYAELGLRNLADERLGGMTLRKAGYIQYGYLVQSVNRGFRKLLNGDEPDEFPRVHLFVQESDIAELDSALPQSGGNYVAAKLFYKGKFNEVSARYRGDFAVHWGYFKRSWRIKTKRNNLFSGLRKFNLIVPKSGLLYSNYIGYEMARMLGVLAPRAELIFLNVNGHNRGLHLLVEQLTESTLRHANRLPGDIYSGDNLYGLDIWSGLESDNLFETPGLWEKSAVNNHYPDDHIYPLERLVDAVARGDKSAILALIDVEAFARLALWEQIGNSMHIDDAHNWRLYFDPGRGRFYPILWDGFPWRAHYLPENWEQLNWTPDMLLVGNRFKAVLLDTPEFMRVRNSVYAEFLESSQPDELMTMVRQLNKKMAPIADKEIAIIDEVGDWVTPAEAKERMAQLPALLAHLIKHLSDHMARAEVVTNAAPPMEPLLWAGEVRIRENTRINQPLVIAPGSRILLSQNVSLFIRQHVEIRGSEQNPVIIDSADSLPFGAIVIEGHPADNSAISWLQMKNGSGYKDDLREYSGMLSIHDVDGMKIENSHFKNNALVDDQIHIVYSEVTIKHSSFSNAPMDAIDLDMSKLTISDSLFTANGNDGLDLMGSSVWGENLTFSGNGDKGISVGERSQLDIADSSFSANQFGLQIKDDSSVTGRYLQFVNNATAIDAYAKNWRYEQGGRGHFCESVFEKNGQRMTADKKSLIQESPNCERKTVNEDHQPSDIGNDNG